MTTVDVSEEHWKGLNQRKRPGDSFDDVIGRLLEGTTVEGIGVGTTEGTPGEGKEGVIDVLGTDVVIHPRIEIDGKERSLVVDNLPEHGEILAAVTEDDEPSVTIDPGVWAGAETG